MTRPARIVRKHWYNGGNGREELSSSEVLYCGYDRLLALRVYHANTPSDSNNCSPGSRYHVTVKQSKEVSEEASDHAST